MIERAESKVVLVREGPRFTREPTEKLRRYRIARVRIAELRAPRASYAHLGRSHD
jgi:hypothetical protein